MAFEYNGKDLEFHEVPWKDLSQEDFDRLTTGIGPLLQGRAEKARGVKQTMIKTGPVTAAIKGKVLESDAYGFFNPALPLFPDPVKKFGFHWWANYFYQECTGPEKRNFYSWVYQPDRSLKRAYDTNPGSPEAWLDLLEGMLEKGFTSYPNDFKQVDDLLFPPIKGEPSLRLGFRGELRQPLQVKAHNGCIPKAQLLSLRQSMGMGSQWHPFSNASSRNKVYFRKGNADNCLYTAVSVAYDFGTASKFPLIDDLYRDAPDSIGVARVLAFGIDSNVAALRAKLGDEITRQHFEPNFRAANTRPGYAPGSMPVSFPGTAVVKANTRAQMRLLKSVRMNVYLFRVRGNLYNTEGFQSKQGNVEFPERAMEAVPWGDFLARVKIDRIHFGESSNDGHLNLVSGFELLHSDEELKRLLGGGAGGGDALSKLKQYLQTLCAEVAYPATIASPMVYSTNNTNPNIRIEQVMSVEPRTDWGLNPSASYKVYSKMRLVPL